MELYIDNMKTKVALLVIYNHRFDRNIDRIRQLYTGRFSHIYHIMPFYDGNEQGVIPVYDSSYCFSGYIAQAYSHLRNEGFTHFFMIADDMILNPLINENSIWENLGVNYGDCYIDEIVCFQQHEKKRWWRRILDALDYTPNQLGVELKGILPNKEQAQKRFDFHKLPYSPIPRKELLRNPKKKAFLKMLTMGRELSYPLVRAYSDILLITSDVMKNFANYCGAFSATRLFVEMAVPTALVLAADNIKTSQDVKLQPGAMWVERDFEILIPYENSLERLLTDFPEQKLYLHPIKLSQWK